MPKIKTHKSSYKRIVRITANGKIVLRKMSAQHRLRFKSKRAKQLSTQTQVAPAGFKRAMKRLAVSA